MSVDYGEKERQFLGTLKADTGRDIDQWMAAIAAAGLTERNDIIDWLRRQGFMFSKASWIERIHNNGGRPVYAERGAPRPRAERRRERPRILTEGQRLFAEGESPATPGTPPLPPPPAATPEPRETPSPASLDALLARAKAYRPLAQFVIAEIKKAVPSVIVVPQDGYAVFRAGERPFALLTITPRELRLALALAAPPAGLALEAARFSPALKNAPEVSHMAVLTDARQITPALMNAATRAAAGG